MTRVAKRTIDSRTASSPIRRPTAGCRQSACGFAPRGGPTEPGRASRRAGQSRTGMGYSGPSRRQAWHRTGVSFPAEPLDRVISIRVTSRIDPIILIPLATHAVRTAPTLQSPACHACCVGARARGPAGHCRTDSSGCTDLTFSRRAFPCRAGSEGLTQSNSISLARHIARGPRVAARCSTCNWESACPDSAGNPWPSTAVPSTRSLALPCAGSRSSSPDAATAG